MKAASGELNLTVITLIAIGAIVETKWYGFAVMVFDIVQNLSYELFQYALAYFLYMICF